VIIWEGNRGNSHEISKAIIPALITEENPGTLQMGSSGTHPNDSKIQCLIELIDLVDS
jgi:hypothetical protein